MKNIRYFCLYAGVSLVIQTVVLLAMGRWWGALLDKFVFVYYPTIWIVEHFGHFTGESNLIEPILIGIPLGVLLYSIILASMFTFIRKSKQRQ